MSGNEICLIDTGFPEIESLLITSRMIFQEMSKREGRKP